MNIKPSAKYTLLFISGILMLTLLLVLLGVYNNNAEAEPATRKELQTSLDSAVEWLYDNKQTVTNIHNSALWWMIREASLITDNEELKQFYLDYKRANLDIRPRNVWSPYFYDDYTPKIDHITDLYPLREYQLFFIYSLSCSPNMSEEPVILKQFEADYCSNHFLHPRCVTHQQMGVRFLNKKGCGDHRELADSLLDIIEQEITWDFRTTDSYLQRALMLADGNRPLKPIWVKKILDAQMDDGGWPDFYPFIELGSLHLGTSSTRPTKGPRDSDFHATAQAIWLITMLIEQTGS